MRGKTTYLFANLLLAVTAAGCDSDAGGDDENADQADQATQKRLAGVYRLETPNGQDGTAGDFRLLVLGKDGEALRQEIPAGAQPCTTSTVLPVSYEAKPKTSTDPTRGKIDLVSSFLFGGQLVETFDYELLDQDTILRLNNRKTGRSFDMRKSKDREAGEGEACLALLSDARIDCADGLVCTQVSGSDRADALCRSPGDLMACPDSFECSDGLACVAEQMCVASGDPDGDPPECPGFCVIDGRDLDTVDDAEFVRMVALRVPSDKFAFPGTEFEPNVQKIVPADLPPDIAGVMETILDARRKTEKDNGFRDFEIEIVDEMLFRLQRDDHIIGFVVTTTSRNGLEDGNLPGDRFFFSPRGFLIEDTHLAESEVGP